MKILILSLLFSLPSWAALTPVSSGQEVSITPLNQNFSYLKSLLVDKNIQAIIPEIESGEVITKEVLEEPMNVIRALGINIPSLPSEEKIKAQSINTFFSQAESAIASFSSEMIEIAVPYNQSFSQQLNFPGLSSSAVYTLNSTASKGTLTLSPSGMLSYTSFAEPSFAGDEIINVSVADGTYSMQKQIKISVSGSGIILSGTSRRYYDGRIAQTCKEYFTKNEGKYNYSGSGVGSGLYRIKPDSSLPAFDATCDMDTNGGGWTQISDTSPTLAELARFGSTSAISGTFTTTAQGFNWGTTVAFNSCQQETAYTYSANIPHSSVRVTYSGTYNNPSGGLGQLLIGNESDVNKYVLFRDRYTNDDRGHYLYVNWGLIFNDDTGAAGRIAVNNRTDVINSTPSSTLKVVMNACVGYAYTRRYIRELWVK